MIAALAIVGGLQNIRVVDFRKHLMFGRDVAYLLWPKLVSFPTVVVLAFHWRSYWALVVGMVAEQVERLILGYALRPYRPRLTLGAFREIFGFSMWMLLNSVVMFLSARMDSLFVGKISGSQALGVNTLAYDLANMATSEFLAPIRRVLLPGFAKLASDLPALRQRFIAIWSIVFMITLPIAAGAGLTADLVVPLMFGPNWIDAVPIAQVLAIYALATTLGSNIAPLFFALGKPRIVTLWIGSGLVILVPALVLGTKTWGPLGAASAIAILSWVIAMTGFRYRFANSICGTAICYAISGTASGQPR